MIRRAVLPTAFAVIIVACRSMQSGPQHTQSTAAQPTASVPSDRADAEAKSTEAGPDAPADASPALEPLTAQGELVPLPVDGFRDSIVSVPLGATERRPVLVALHGNYDRPEWQCEVWRGLVGGNVFVLCPRGIPRDDAPKSEDRWTYGAAAQTEKELFAGLEALKRRFPKHARADRVVFTGFSLGAIQGRGIVQRHPETFPRAVLTEGAYDGWSAALGKKLRESGVERVLFACGQSACVQSARQSARNLEKGGTPARVANGGNAGHTYDGSVAEAISREWRWLVEGETGW